MILNLKLFNTIFSFTSKDSEPNLLLREREINQTDLKYLRRSSSNSKSDKDLESTSRIAEIYPRCFPSIEKEFFE